MKTSYSIFILIFLSQLITSCKKSEWFDVKSDINQTVPATLQDFEYLLDNYAVMNIQTPGLAEVGSDGHYITETIWSGSLGDLERNTYTWTNNLQTQIVTDWNESYKKIFHCNLVLNGLNKIPAEQDISRYNTVKGTALFHRAKNYYDLAQVYAQPYNSASAASDMGIPLKEGIDVTEPARRSSVKATYDQILADLLTAITLLPNLPELKTRCSKASVYALLARTYLVIGDYVNAGLYADASLKLCNTLIDFNNIPATNINMGQFNAETIFYAQVVTNLLSTWFDGYYGIDTELYNLYEINDLRRTRFFRLNGSNILFKGNYNNVDVRFNGLAVDEQYLIRAECYARVGNVDGAMKDLNDLLKTRWNNAVTYPIRVASGAEDALRQILLERKKELLFRNLRWTDLRRLNLDPRFKVTLTRTIGGKTYILEPNSYKYTLPIPHDIMNLAPQMKQAPGWE